MDKIETWLKSWMETIGYDTVRRNNEYFNIVMHIRKGALFNINSIKDKIVYLLFIKDINFDHKNSLKIANQNI